MRLRRSLPLFALIALFIASAPASAATTEFRADVHDAGVCPDVDLCGTGVIQGYGTVTTTLTFATGERVFILDSDGSTLTLLVEATGTTGSRLTGTWTIISGTGVFAGAEGSGEVWATPTGIPVTSDTAHYRGTITTSG
jgi:hypothetical protein